MKKSLLVFVGLLISCSSFNSNKRKEKYVLMPILYDKSVYLKKEFNEPFFSEEYFGYLKNREPSHDTLKQYYTSETTILEDTNKYFLRTCIVQKSYDSLILILTDSPFSESPYELNVLKLKNKYSINLRQTFSIIDSSYKPPKFNVLANSNIILNKNEYEKGDSLKGKIVIDILANHYWEKPYKDTISIRGLIKTIVK